MKIFVSCLLIVLFLIPINAIADDENIIFITKSESMEDVIFDGRWSFTTEWKESSWNNIKSDEATTFHLRSAHYGDFIYFQINVTSDTNPEFDIDKSIICIDTENNKSESLDENDYCFVVKLQESNFFGNLFSENNERILKGTSSAKTFDELEQITSEKFVGVGTMSDDNDRYSSTPHATYEFKIPTDLVGRSDNYGILFMAYDSNSNSTYTWPQNSEFTIEKIPSPASWGNLVSPDKSLPEFSWSVIVMISFLIMVVVLPLANRFGRFKI